LSRYALIVGASLLVTAALVAVLMTVSFHSESAESAKTPDVHRWPRPGRKPLSDKRAAAAVRHVSEAVADNANLNRYVPSRAELAAFRSARDDQGLRTTRVNPLLRHVTGRSRLRKPSTDDLIQWASHKWRIPTDWIRAQMMKESTWRQSDLGDRETVPARWYGLYPPQARVAGTSDVYQSMGLSQIKWRPDGSQGAGTEPLRWKSTAFSLDYYGAWIRYFYDGLCNWCGSGYKGGQAWSSIGAWFQPDPWANPDAREYVRDVREALAERSWPG
jgi:hypothetical protein